LVGGVDSWLAPETIEWLESDERLHNAANPWGLVPGEGAAFCVISDSMQQTKAQRALEIIGFGASKEPIPRRGDAPCLGKGLTEAIQKTLLFLTEGQLVDEVICDLNGEMDRADEYGFAVVRTSDRFVDASAARAPADCWGDVGAATGPLLLSLAREAVNKQWFGGSNILLWSSSDGADRAATLLRAIP
jgi:3-oxoacyl-[acyl-carrier-protein] synthase I